MTRANTLQAPTHESKYTSFTGLQNHTYTHPRHTLLLCNNIKIVYNNHIDFVNMTEQILFADEIRLVNI